MNLVDKLRYPLTTQDNLSERDQSLIDSINLDQLREAIADGEILTGEEKARLAELEEKHKLRVEFARAAGKVFTGEYGPKEEPSVEESSSNVRRFKAGVRIPPPDGRPMMERFGLAHVKFRTPTLDDLK